MPEYVLDHHQEGERQRLTLMSRSPDGRAVAVDLDLDLSLVSAARERH